MHRRHASCDGGGHPESGNRTGVTHVATGRACGEEVQNVLRDRKSKTLWRPRERMTVRECAAAFLRQVEHAPRVNILFPRHALMGSPRTAPRKEVDLWNKRTLNSSASI